jgi:hypothetical protein
MKTTAATYEIVIEGQLDRHWSAWFEHLAISHPTTDTTRLLGSLPDQAALFGVLKKLHNLGLRLVLVRRVAPADDSRGEEVHLWPSHHI